MIRVPGVSGGHGDRAEGSVDLQTERRAPIGGVEVDDAGTDRVEAPRPGQQRVKGASCPLAGGTMKKWGRPEPRQSTVCER